MHQSDRGRNLLSFQRQVPDSTTLEAERARIDGKIRSSVDLLNLPMIINISDSVYPDLKFNDGKLSIGTYTLQCSNTILHTRQSYYDANLDSEGLGDIQVSRQLEDFKSQRHLLHWWGCSAHSATEQQG